MKKWFQNIKLRTKMFVIIIGVVLILFVTSMVSQKNIHDAYNEQLYEETAHVLTAFSGEVETQLQKMKNLTLMILSDSVVQESLTYMQDAAEHEWDTWREWRTKLNEKVNYYLSQGDYLKSLKILSENGSYLFQENWDKGYEQYVQAAMEAAGKMVLIPSDNKLMLAREVRQMEDLRLDTLGIIVAEIDMKELLEDQANKFKQIGTPIEIAVFGDGYCVCENINGPVPELSPADGWEIEDGNFLVTSSSKRMNLRFLTTTSYEAIEEAIKETIFQGVLSLIIVGVLACAGALVLIHSFTRELSTLVLRMDKVGTGIIPSKVDILPYANRHDEIARLYRHFYRMLRDYQTVTAAYYDSKLHLKDAQFRQLQKQIQPHFLFNTLNTISAMAYKENAEDVAYMIERLGNMLRKTISQTKTLISVGEDMEMVEDYLYIQKTRYKERLLVSIDIPEEGRNLLIPPITIQPIVENCVTHVLEEILEPCCIEISCQLDEKDARIVISDNDPGITQEQFQNVLQSVKDSSHGIGLTNIHKRLQLAFSEQYGLSVSRQDGKMAMVIRIPKTPDKGGINLAESIDCR